VGNDTVVFVYLDNVYHHQWFDIVRDITADHVARCYLCLTYSAEAGKQH
jgi:hypothetical protein